MALPARINSDGNRVRVISWGGSAQDSSVKVVSSLKISVSCDKLPSISMTSFADVLGSKTELDPAAGLACSNIRGGPDSISTSSCTSDGEEAGGERSDS